MTWKGRNSSRVDQETAVGVINPTEEDTVALVEIGDAIVGDAGVYDVDALVANTRRQLQGRALRHLVVPLARKSVELFQIRPADSQGAL